MKKIALILVMLAASLTACGADTVSETASEAQAKAENMVASTSDTVKKAATEVKTVVTKEAMEALSAMGAETGRDNFDAAGILTRDEGKFVVGKDYTVLSPAQPTSSDPSVVEVAEVFMYSCPHCYSLEPFMNEWLQRKPVGVNLIRIPAQFNRPAQLHAAAYYTAQALGVSEQVHIPIFKAIHGERKPLSSEAAIRDVFVANGVDGDTFDKNFSSFEVDTKTRQAQNLSMRYKITSVPTLVVNGKYVTSASMAGSHDRLNQILDYLMALELSNQ